MMIMRLNTFPRRAAVAMLVTATVGMAACSKSGPKCSDPAVTATVKKLVAEQLQQNYGLSVIYDVKNSEYDLRSIRTSRSEPTRCACQAELVLRLKLSAEVKAGLEQKAANAGTQQIQDTMLRERDQKIDLQYRAEQTDDGSDTYITIEPFQ
ncbi:hypothetical protein RPMA_02295 [Tardiphaga alba]|uniref:Lipoprotein n=1 Tax=Tardiphaga alba TaxID=340268 RepID=A0ABX8A2Q4_9BRAD|nr:hypothetical protein [Tardiphaga alba]QUS37823.1 hypothetical protein RPMA_02295 [Tardiphaga alba]